MSTWIYLQCLSHDPPLRSDYELGQHLYDLPDARRYLADREHLIALTEDDNNNGVNRELEDMPRWRSNAAWFLHDHQKCEVGIVDEYGKTHPTVVEGES